MAAKSKKEREREETNKLSDYYRQMTDEQLWAVKNSPFQNPSKSFRVAVNNELKARGFKTN